MAKEKGFYEEVGLEVSIKESDSTTQSTDDVINGKTDFAIGRSSIIHDRLEGKPVVMLASIFQHSPAILLAKRREDLQKISDFKNKRIMLSNDHIGLAAINAMLLSSGVKQNMYKTQAQSFNVDDLINNKTDAILAYTSNEPFALSQKNIEYKIFSPKEFGFDFYSDILFTSESLIQKKPDMVKNFRSASLKGWEYAMNNPDEAVKLILDKYNTQNKSKEALDFEAKTMIKLINKEHVPIGDISKKRVEDVANIYRLMGFVTKNISLENLIYKDSTIIDIGLTREEKEWIRTNTIKVGGESDWAPFDFVKDGEYQGISKDFVDLISQKTGLKIEYVTGQTWKELVSDFKSAKLDVLPAMYYTKSREDFTEFTKPYFKIKDYAFARSDDDSVKSIDGLKNKIIAVIDGYAVIENLQDKFSNINLLKVKSIHEGIDAVLLHKADVYIDAYPTMTYTLTSMMQTGIKPVLPLNFYSNDLHIGINKSKPILTSIISKGLNSITLEEKNKIIQEWRATDNKKPTLKLNEDERAWLQQHPVIKVANDSEWPPFDFYENGKTKGYNMDYLRLLAEIIGIKLEFVQDTSWENLIKQFESGEIDLITAYEDIPENHKYALFTEPFLETYESIIIRKDTPFLKNYKDLYGKKVAAIKGYDYVDEITNNHPLIDMVLVDTAKEGLKKVAYREADALLENSSVADYLIKKHSFSNLILAGDASFPGLEVGDKIAIAVRKELPELHSLLVKAMKNIPEKSFLELKKRWLGSTIQEKKIELTQKEKEWIKNHSEVTYSEVNWKPLSIIENNTMNGIIGDFLELTSKRTGIKFKFVASDSWLHVIENFKERKIDLIPGITSSDEAREMGLLSESFAQYPMAIVTTNKYKFIDSLRELDDKTIAVQKYNTSYNFMLKHYPNIKLISTTDIPEALMLVQNGQADAFVDHIAASLFYISELGLNDLKISGTTSSEYDHRYLIQNDNPELLTILNKALKSITEQDKAKIYANWIHTSLEEKVDYTLVIQISLALLLVVIAVLYWNYKLKSIVNKKTSELQSSLKSFDKNVIASKTDLKGVIISASEAFCKISGYKLNELVGKPHNIIRHPDTPSELFADMWKTLKLGNIWKGEIKNLKKDGGFYWTSVIAQPDYDSDGKHIGYSAIRQDITAQKEVEELSDSLERKVEERTGELNEQKEFVQILLDSQEQIIVTTDGLSLITANESFMKFFTVDCVEKFIQEYDSKCICDTFNTKAPEGYLQKMMGNEKWIDYIIARSHSNITHKAMITRDNIDYIFSVTAAILPGDKGLKSAVFTNITEMEKAKQEVESIHKHTKESIEYAALIQGALIPDNQIFRNFFQDYFAIWHPKDIVGGDIYLVSEINENELIIMVIDCTGHGVPGAFVTMLVKAIERQLMANVQKDEVISPAKILSIFNKSIKHLLKQETVDSVSNAGFDGGIIYYNKQEKIIKFAGAETALMYMDEDNEFQTIKGSRHSIGYKKSDPNFEFKEHTIKVKDGMQFYCTTDGYLDQNGGEKGFPFGKKKFQSIIKEYHGEKMANQQEMFLNELDAYQGEEETNDDVTLVGFKI